MVDQLSDMSNNVFLPRTGSYCSQMNIDGCGSCEICPRVWRLHCTHWLRYFSASFQTRQDFWREGLSPPPIVMVIAHLLLLTGTDSHDMTLLEDNLAIKDYQYLQDLKGCYKVFFCCHSYVIIWVEPRSRMPSAGWKKTVWTEIQDFWKWNSVRSLVINFLAPAPLSLNKFRNEISSCLSNKKMSWKLQVVFKWNMIWFICQGRHSNVRHWHFPNHRTQ